MTNCYCNDSEKCKSCVYVGTMENDLACFFILRTGKSRKCPGGDKCTEYVKNKSGKRTGRFADFVVFGKL